MVTKEDSHLKAKYTWVSNYTRYPFFHFTTTKITVGQSEAVATVLIS